MSAAVDVVVVGAGTAGPVIAALLSEELGLQVALVEAGGENVNDVGRMQGALFYTWRTARASECAFAQIVPANERRLTAPMAWC